MQIDSTKLLAWYHSLTPETIEELRVFFQDILKEHYRLRLLNENDLLTSEALEPMARYIVIMKMVLHDMGIVNHTFLEWNTVRIDRNKTDKWSDVDFLTVMTTLYLCLVIEKLEEEKSSITIEWESDDDGVSWSASMNGTDDSKIKRNILEPARLFREVYDALRPLWSVWFVKVDFVKLWIQDIIDGLDVKNAQDYHGSFVLDRGIYEYKVSVSAWTDADNDNILGIKTHSQGR